MAQRDFEYFLKNAEAYESLNVDQLNALGRGEMIEYGDTETPPVEENGATESGEPPVTTEPEILAKDGKHTIPYSELEEARSRADAAEQLAKTQAELIDNLKAAKVSDAGTGETEAQDDVLADFKSQYPELAEMLAPALQKMIDGRASELEKRFTEALEPIQKNAQLDSIDTHFTEITDAIPDFDALVESGEVEKWIETLPGFAKEGALKVLSEGTAPEIIELFTQYKNSVEKPIEKTEADIKQAAADAVAKAKGGKPTSLSDLPAGQVSTHAEEPTTVEGWSKVFAGKSPEAILKMM